MFTLTILPSANNKSILCPLGHIPSCEISNLLIVNKLHLVSSTMCTVYKNFPLVISVNRIYRVYTLTKSFLITQFNIIYLLTSKSSKRSHNSGVNFCIRLSSYRVKFSHPLVKFFRKE